MSMSGIVPTVVLDIALGIMAISVLMCLYRIIKGPSAADRAVASDALGTCVMAAISIYSLKLNTLDYLNAVLVIAILGFLALIVVAKFIGGGGDVIDRDNS
ncbi:MAG: monovalent cation/H+ antiporter complex subunit F [Bacillota bacterium]|nr:monovalent cation/H+ antiporter complex subunit F [Bacillota bacterium]